MLFTFFLPMQVAGTMPANATLSCQQGRHHQDNHVDVTDSDMSVTDNALIDVIEHPDPPTSICEQEARQFSDAQHAGFIERTLDTTLETSPPYSDAGQDE